MKILLVTHQFLPDFSGGTEVLTYNTARELTKLGHDVVVFTGYPAKGKTNQNQLDYYGYKEIRVVRFRHVTVASNDQDDLGESEYNNRLSYSLFKNYLLDARPDLVHFYHMLRISASAIDACHDLKVPSIFTA